MCFWRILFSYFYDRMLYPNLWIRFFLSKARTIIILCLLYLCNSPDGTTDKVITFRGGLQLQSNRLIEIA